MGKREAEVYRPADACRIAEVAPYVLRYWETEFPALSEGKDKGASKLYTARDVKIIARIRELLYDEGFTVAGAKKRLDAEITEGRFDDGLAPAPSRKSEKPERAPGKSVPAPQPTILPAVGTAPAPRPAATSSSSSSSGLDRKGVVRELKEIVRMLDRSRAK